MYVQLPGSWQTSNANYGQVDNIAGNQGLAKINGDMRRFLMLTTYFSNAKWILKLYMYIHLRFLNADQEALCPFGNKQINVQINFHPRGRRVFNIVIIPNR